MWFILPRKKTPSSIKAVKDTDGIPGLQLTKVRWRRTKYENVTETETETGSVCVEGPS